jgi:hypothetical protein
MDIPLPLLSAARALKDGIALLLVLSSLLEAVMRRQL